MQSVIPFHDFCGRVLGINLTPGQRVIAKVAFGKHDPMDLEGEERALALQMFGGVERVSELARKFVLLRLGRGSGKTTLCSAFSVYKAVTADVSKCGPGDVPYVIVVAPDKETAKLSIRMAREMIRSNPALENLLEGEEAQVITLRRPDGKQVKIESFAASRGGSSMRGRSIMAFLMDEAEFFTSNSSESTRDYSINDKDIFNALKPRLMPDGIGMLISTPWPVETLMGTMFDENWTKCRTATAIKAPTLLVRGDDPDIKALVEDELARDLENARRELFCELEGISGGEFFDLNALNLSLEEVGDRFPVPFNPAWPVAIGCDLGFVRDSSSIVAVQWDGHVYRTVFAEEMHPKPGKPLSPSSVMNRFAIVAKQYGGIGVVADSYYRESLKEQLAESGLVVYEALEGTKGKAEIFQRCRAVMNEGQIRIPDNSIGRRILQQARLVVSKPTPGGTTTIRIPRKIGMGHGDMVSAWSLAVHKLAYARLTSSIPVYEPGTSEWFNESQRRLTNAFERQQADYLKKIDKEVAAIVKAKKRLGIYERKV